MKYKVVPFNKKVLVEKVMDITKNISDDLEGIIIPKFSTISKKREASEAKYIFKVINSHNSSIIPGMYILSDSTNLEEYKFTLGEETYILTFLDELDIIALLEENV